MGGFKDEAHMTVPSDSVTWFFLVTEEIGKLFWKEQNLVFYTSVNYHSSTQKTERKGYSLDRQLIQDKKATLRIMIVNIPSVFRKEYMVIFEQSTN